jgi:hypothetical protein
MLIGNEYEAHYNAQMIGMGLANLKFFVLNGVKTKGLLDFKDYLKDVESFRFAPNFSSYEGTVNENLKKLKADIDSDARGAIGHCSKVSEDVNYVYLKMMLSPDKKDVVTQSSD